MPLLALHPPVVVRSAHPSQEDVPPTGLQRKDDDVPKLHALAKSPKLGGEVSGSGRRLLRIELLELVHEVLVRAKEAKIRNISESNDRKIFTLSCPFILTVFAGTHEPHLG